MTSLQRQWVLLAFLQMQRAAVLSVLTGMANSGQKIDVGLRVAHHKLTRDMRSGSQVRPSETLIHSRAEPSFVARRRSGLTTLSIIGRRLISATFSVRPEIASMLSSIRYRIHAMA